MLMLNLINRDNIVYNIGYTYTYFYLYSYMCYSAI